MKGRVTYGVAKRLYVTQTSTHCELRALEGADERSREEGWWWKRGKSGEVEVRRRGQLYRNPTSTADIRQPKQAVSPCSIAATRCLVPVENETSAESQICEFKENFCTQATAPRAAPEESYSYFHIEDAGSLSIDACLRKVGCHCSMVHGQFPRELCQCSSQSHSRLSGLGRTSIRILSLLFACLSEGTREE